MAQKTNSILARLRADFFAGLALVLPGVVSVGIVMWLFHNVAGLTANLLLPLPDTWTHPKLPNGQLGEIYWYWSCVSVLVTIALICLVGRYGRYYIGRKMLEWMYRFLMSLPLVNKIYGTVKQVNQSFSSNKSSFKQVVLVSFPHERSRTIGFVTGEQKGLDAENLISVFVPTTPNPTSGFLLLVPESEIIKLDISVAEGIKFLISLGAISPDYAGHAIHRLPPGKSPPDPAQK